MRGRQNRREQALDIHRPMSPDNRPPPSDKVNARSRIIVSNVIITKRPYGILMVDLFEVYDVRLLPKPRVVLSCQPLLPSLWKVTPLSSATSRNNLSALIKCSNKVQLNHLQ